MEPQETKDRRERIMGENNPTKRAEVRKKISESLKKAWAKPEVRAKMTGDRNPTKREDVKKKISESLRKTWMDPVKKEAIKAKIAETKNRKKAEKAVRG